MRDSVTSACSESFSFSSFLSAESKFEISNRFHQVICCAGVAKICRGKNGLWEFISQSAAAGLLWLSEGERDLSGLVPGGLQANYSIILSGLVVKTAVEEGLNGADGPDVVLVFPSLDEGDEPGRVQMCAVMTR